MALAENASNDSAQSPAWSRKPWPAATLASAAAAPPTASASQSETSPVSQSRSGVPAWQPSWPLPGDPASRFRAAGEEGERPAVRVVDAHPLPRVEYLLEQRAPVVEVPVEAAPGDAERPRQQLDPDGVRAAGGKRPQPLFDPAAAWRACRGGHHLSVSRPARSLTAPQMMAKCFLGVVAWPG